MKDSAQPEKGYLERSTNSEPENPCDQANKYRFSIRYSLDKNAEMIAKVKSCFRHLPDLHRKVKETVKIEGEQSMKFNVDREINGARALKNDSKN